MRTARNLEHENFEKTKLKIAAKPKKVDIQNRPIDLDTCDTLRERGATWLDRCRCGQVTQGQTTLWSQDRRPEILESDKCRTPQKNQDLLASVQGDLVTLVTRRPMLHICVNTTSHSLACEC